MDEQTKRKMIRNYFKPFPKWAIWMIVIGLVVLLIGFSTGASAIIVGLVIAGIGGFGIYSYGQGKPTDQQMDEWLEEDLKDLNRNPLTSWGSTRPNWLANHSRLQAPVSGMLLTQMFSSRKERTMSFGSPLLALA